MRRIRVSWSMQYSDDVCSDVTGIVDQSVAERASTGVLCGSSFVAGCRGDCSKAMVCLFELHHLEAALPIIAKSSTALEYA